VLVKLIYGLCASFRYWEMSRHFAPLLSSEVHAVCFLNETQHHTN